MARPEWCKSFNCPNSPGDFCYINEWILRGWPSKRVEAIKFKESLREKYRVIAQKNPTELIQECVDKSFDIR